MLQQELKQLLKQRLVKKACRTFVDWVSPAKPFAIGKRLLRSETLDYQGFYKRNEALESLVAFFVFKYRKYRKGADKNGFMNEAIVKNRTKSSTFIVNS